MLDSVLSPLGLPKKVVKAAYAEGVHADCLIAGYENSCDDCRVLTFRVLFNFYGGLETFEEIVIAISADLLEDSNE